MTLLCGWVCAQPAYDFTPLTRQIRQWVDKGYYSGASMLIIKNDKQVYEQYFGSYSPQTQVYIASAGKWLAAATFAAVVDEGKLSWDDKVVKWLPDWTDAKGQATLRQLLSHTAGYPDYQPVGHLVDRYQTLTESVAHIKPLPLDALPGTRFLYGGLAMQVAGRMAELATGNDWETLFQTKIARPLGMTATRFTPVDSADGHSPMLGGGARSTLHDYIRFLDMIYHGGLYKGNRILSTTALAAMQADQVGKADIRADSYIRTAYRPHTDLYGLGEWRAEVDARGRSTLLTSPSWAGAYPWIDRTANLYGFFLTHLDVNGPARVDSFNAFYASPALPGLVRQVTSKSRKP
ncbi:serine hydrolase domain-containing protein [Spirosoma oryzae]|nr:serine hydrolase domain-containing protein [Spirosoma oryzae]